MKEFHNNVNVLIIFTHEILKGSCVKLESDNCQMVPQNAANCKSILLSLSYGPGARLGWICFVMFEEMKSAYPTTTRFEKWQKKAIIWKEGNRLLKVETQEKKEKYWHRLLKPKKKNIYWLWTSCNYQNEKYLLTFQV